MKRYFATLFAAFVILSAAQAITTQTALAAPATAQTTLSTAKSESEKIADTMRLTLNVNNPIAQTNTMPWGFTINGTDHATYCVDWGDGTPIETITHNFSIYNTAVNHKYAAIGVYKIKAWSGKYNNTQSPNPDSIPRITKVILGAGFTTMDATGLLYLNDLNCNVNDLQMLDVSGCAYLPSLTTYSRYDTIKMRGCTALKTVTMHGSSRYLDFSDCENLDNITYTYGTSNGVSNKTNLSTTDLTYLDMSNCKSIKELTVGDVSTRNLAYLNVDGCTALTKLDCRNNQLKSLDVSSCADLQELWAFANQLTSLNVNGCSKLQKLSCAWNKLSSLDVSSCTNLIGLYCYDNKFTSLDVSRNTKLSGLECNINQLEQLNVSQNTALTSLYCDRNKLSSLNISQNTTLTILSCYNNQLGSLDVSQNTALTTLYCHNNQLTSLDVNSCTVLKILYCYNNQLPSLDVSKNTALTTLYCHNNQLRELNLHDGGSKLGVFWGHNNHLPLAVLYPYMARRGAKADYKLSPQTDSKILSNREEKFDLKSEMNFGGKKTAWTATKFDGTAVDDAVTESNGVFSFKKKGQYYLVLENDLVRQQTTTSNVADNTAVEFRWSVEVKNELYHISTRTANIKYGSVTGEGWYEEGKTVTITAVPRPGYRFVKWENVLMGMEFSTKNVHQFKAAQDLTLMAYFEEATYDITVQANNADWGEVSGGGTYRENAGVTISATPKEGYRFVKWVNLLTGEDFATTANHEFRATQILHLRAYFEKIPLYTIAVQTAHADWGSVTGSGTYKEDSTVVITATAKEGYYFVKWKNGEAVFTKIKNYNFRAKENLTLTAEFEAVSENMVRVMVKPDGFSKGNAIVTGDGIYKPGDTVTIMAAPKEGHRFENWQRIKNKNKEQFALNADTTFVVAEDMELWAYFRNMPPHTITVQANNADWGHVTGGGDKVPELANVTITAEPNYGYRFVEWMYIDRGAQLEVFSKKSDTTFKATQDLTLTANFEEIVYNITAQSDNIDWGRVTGGGTYKEDANVKIVATPKEGYRFIEWKNLDAIFSLEAELEFVASKDLNLTAYFAESPNHIVNVSANPDEWGEVSGEGVYKENTNATIKAKAKRGYKFVQWMMGEKVFALSTDTTFKVMEDMELVAMFEQDPNAHIIVVRSNDSTLGKASLSTGEYSAIYNNGEEVTIVATPIGREVSFTNWVCSKADGKSEVIFAPKSVYTFKATENLVLTAYFEAEPYVYVVGRVIYLPRAMGRVQLFNMTGLCVYDGTATAIEVISKGTYVLRAQGKYVKVLVP